MITKFIHIGDLHLGIKFHKHNLIEDQRNVLNQMVEYMEKEKTNLVIAGDVFDTVNPPIDAQQLWFEFLEKVSENNQKNGTHALIIAGNHDSSPRLSLASAFLDAFNVHIVSPDKLYEVFDINGCKLVCVPFAKPEHVSYILGTEFQDYDSAYAAIIEEVKKEVGDLSDCILVAHQSFEGCQIGESEFKPFMSDSIAAKTVSEFKYAWVGHIHGYQALGNIQYCGSLLQYAFGDEYAQVFCVWSHDSDKIDNRAWKLQTVEFELLHPLKLVIGDLDHCLEYKDNGEYYKFVLKDYEDYDRALNALREKFKYVLSVVKETGKKWEADLTKPVGNFLNFQDALDAFCEQLEIPKFTGRNAELIQEAVDAYKKIED